MPFQFLISADSFHSPVSSEDWTSPAFPIFLILRRLFALNYSNSVLSIPANLNRLNHSCRCSIWKHLHLANQATPASNRPVGQIVAHANRASGRGLLILNLSLFQISIFDVSTCLTLGRCYGLNLSIAVLALEHERERPLQGRRRSSGSNHFHVD